MYIHSNSEDRHIPLVERNHLQMALFPALWQFELVVQAGLQKSPAPVLEVVQNSSQWQHYPLY
jgi:hypothetical protein